MNDVSSLTLAVTRNTLDFNKLTETIRVFPSLKTVNLFLMQQGTLLVDASWRTLPAGERVFCAFNHRRHQGPSPALGMEAGGLASLADMIRRSEVSLSWPHCHQPTVPAKHANKVIGILFNETKSWAVEALRVATGLAGCNHKLRILRDPAHGCPQEELSAILPEATDYLEVLPALGAFFGVYSRQAFPDDLDVMLRL